MDLCNDVLAVFGQLRGERHRLRGGDGANADDHAEREQHDDERRRARGRASSARGGAPPARAESANRIASASGISTSSREVEHPGGDEQPDERDAARACLVHVARRSPLDQLEQQRASAPSLRTRGRCRSGWLFDQRRACWCRRRSSSALRPRGAAGSLNFTTSCHVLKTMSSVASAPRLADAGLLRAAVEQHAEAAHVAVVPLLLGASPRRWR